jgi:hypothetical protein
MGDEYHNTISDIDFMFVSSCDVSIVQQVYEEQAVANR